MNKKKEYMGIAMKGMMDAMKAMEKAMENDAGAEAPAESEPEQEQEHEQELDKALAAAVNEPDEAAPVEDISENSKEMDKGPGASYDPEVMGIPAALMHGIIGHGGYMKAYGGMEYKGMRNDFLSVNGHLRDLAKKADGMGNDEE
jgi:hypothetical protein